MNLSWKAVIAVALAAPALVPAAARAAGTYDVWSCRAADGSALATSAFTPSGHTADTCATGGALSITPDGSLRLAAPAGTTITHYELWRSADDGPKADDTAIVETAGSTSFTVSSGTVGNPHQTLSVANHFVGRHSPLSALTLQIACDEGCTDGTRMDLYGAHVTLSDTTAPTAAAQPAGDDAVIVNADDVGGGVAAVTMAVDNGGAVTLASDCTPPYTALVPCPSEVARAFAIAAPDGAHTVSGTVVDAAGNSTAWGPIGVTIRHGVVVASPSPTPTSAPVTLASEPGQVLRLARGSLDHAPGSVARLTGTLRTAAGAPVAGAKLTVSSFDLASDKALPLALPPVTTDSSGAFSVSLKRDGAQRVTITAPSGTSATATVRTNLSVAVRSSKGRLVKGRLLTLSGTLRGAGASAKGTVVTIQSIVNGAWAPVGSARAKADGGYTWRYRFVHLQQDTIFRFRAIVERGPGWPWPSERSAAIKVRVDVP